MESPEKARDWKVVASRDLAFHTELVSAAGSPRLERMFTTVISETRLCLGGADRRLRTPGTTWSRSTARSAT